MLARILALFLITPVVELALLLHVGSLIGFFPTIGLILATGVAGSFLARREGLSVWTRFHARLKRGELPGTELVDGMIILVAGALLITPGVLTDIVGFLGLVPLTRPYIRRYINQRMQRAAERGSVRVTFGGFRTSDEYGSPPEVHGPEDAAASDENLWRGRGRDMPGHGQE